MNGLGWDDGLGLTLRLCMGLEQVYWFYEVRRCRDSSIVRLEVVSWWEMF
jgi:hypothetical protein